MTGADLLEALAVLGARTVTIARLLEWTAFGASLCCVFCYGHNKRHGAVVGLTTAVLFVVWGLVAGVPAAALTNVFFFGLHARNLRRAFIDAKQPDVR